MDNIFYNIGDKIKIKSSLNENDSYPCGVTIEMTRYKGMVATITNIIKPEYYNGKYYDTYELDVDGGYYSWTSPMFENNTLSLKLSLVRKLFGPIITDIYGNNIDDELGGKHSNTRAFSIAYDFDEMGYIPTKSDLLYINKTINKLIKSSEDSRFIEMNGHQLNPGWHKALKELLTLLKAK